MYPNSVIRTFSAASSIALVFALVSTQAQNFRAAPTYGFVTLAHGFGDDVMREVTAGGHTNARDLSLPRACEGYINVGAPDLSLNYEAGSGPLQVFVQSAADTTLIINDPLGQWQCDDDSLGVNPAKRFSNPPSGQYDIWVGTFDPAPANARVFFADR